MNLNMLRVLLAVVLLALVPVLILQGPVEGDGSFQGFLDVAQERFDDLSRPSFLAASDWNDDGYIDLLANGNRLYMNTGPPTYSFQLMTDVFANSTSGARIGVWGDLDGDGDLDLFQGCNKGTGDLNAIRPKHAGLHLRAQFG